MPEFLKEREVLASFVAITVGLVLLVVGLVADDGELRTSGVTLVLGGVAALGVTRGLAKMNQRPPSGGVMTALLSMVLLCGCGSRGKVDAEVVRDLVQPISARHDAYVTADPQLDDLDRRAYLRSTGILHDLLEAATQ